MIVWHKNKIKFVHPMFPQFLMNRIIWWIKAPCLNCNRVDFQNMLGMINYYNNIYCTYNILNVNPIQWLTLYNYQFNKGFNIFDKFSIHMKIFKIVIIIFETKLNTIHKESLHPCKLTKSQYREALMGELLNIIEMTFYYNFKHNMEILYIWKK
jgi:hypothetical protein